jgi:quercetin dioxygenase-like cupin family protein
MRRSLGTVLGAFIAGAALPAGAHAAGATPGYATPGLSAEQLARLPGITYARPLIEKPTRNLVVLRLSFPPKGGTSSSPNPWSCHRPSGPVTIHVTKGAVRLALNGQPARILRAGKSLYEPARSLHSTAENAGNVEPAEAFAVIAVPQGAPILIAEANCGADSSH